MRILGTLIAPTAGSAVIDSIPLSPASAAEIRQRISIMPEAPGLYRRLTVTENLEFFARLYGLPQREARMKQAWRRSAWPTARTTSPGACPRGCGSGRPWPARC